MPRYRDKDKWKTVRNSDFLVGAKILVDAKYFVTFGMACQYKQAGTLREAFRSYKLTGRL
jgi:hypothetical protein